MPDNTHPLLTGEQIDEMIINGETYTTIGRMYGMTRQGVRKRRFYIGDVERRGVWYAPRELAEQYMPWPKGAITNPHNRRYRALKGHSQWQVRNEESDLKAPYRQHLIALYRELITDSLIVEYDPTIPPGSEDGFSLKRRTKADARLVIRRNKNVPLGDDQEDFWSFPRIMPKGAEQLLSQLNQGTK